MKVKTFADLGIPTFDESEESFNPNNNIQPNSGENPQSFAALGIPTFEQSQKELLEGNDYSSIGKTAARSAKSVISGALGSIPDTITSAYNIPASLENSKTPQMREASQAMSDENPFAVGQDYGRTNLPLIPSVTEAVDKGIDTATGGYTHTKEGDSLQSGLKFVSSVAAPGGLVRSATKYGLEKTSKALNVLGTTKPSSLVAAGATGVATEEAHKAGYNTPASIGIGLGVGAGVGGSIQALKNLDVKLALAKLTGNSPKNINLEAVKAAESSGIPYSNTLVNESNALAYVDQLISKSPYFGTNRARKLSAHDKEFSAAVENSIKKVGERIVETDSSLDTGEMIKDVFTDLKGTINNTKDILYDQSNALLPKEAQHIPNRISESIKEIRGGIRTLKPSDDELYVLNYINDVEKQIVLGSQENKMLLPVPVDLIVGLKRSINDTIDWNIKAKGPKKLLRKLQTAIKEDLSEYGKKNQEWYKKFQEADEYYGKYLGNEALGSDFIKNKILDEDNPEKIISSIKNISDFKALEQSLGANANGQAFFNSIKHEKLSDLIMGKTINPQTQNISYIGFAKSIENPNNKELIKYLAGDSYKEIQNFSKYAQAAIKRNQRIPNPSGTAPTKTIYGALASAVTGGIAGGIAGSITSGVAPLAGLGALGTGLNWLVNNKTVLKWGIEAAKKQAAGDFKAVSTYSKRIENAMTKDLGPDFVREFIALSKEFETDQE